MNHLRARRVFAWIALAAITLAALAPTVSRALARAVVNPPGWNEVCTASGMQTLAVALAGDTATDPAAERAPAPGPTLDHCPFCLLGADRLGPPPGPAARVMALGDPLAPPGGPETFVRTTAPLLALARGPPLNTAPPSVA